jgi:methoxymalonate biosynthesis protein
MTAARQQASRPAAATVIKCVAWDIDNTLLAGTFIESGMRPPADPEMAAALAELGSRGIVHAIATRNPPAAASYAAQVTGAQFVAVQAGWGRKSAAISRILAELGISADALAFVDDDPYERAEVSFALPDVLVLSPEDMTDALGWPEFSPAVVTDEARRRSELYLDRKRRQDAEREFGGSRDDFLRYCRTEISVGPASEADVARLHELSVRTHQFNSAGHGATEATFHAMIDAPGQQVLTVRLRDRFGDDGIVGGCVTEQREDGIWTVRLLMMSCRAMGRGVIDTLLAWLIRSAAGHGARTLELPSVLNARNVPLRLALAAAGFRAPGAEPDPAGGAAADAGHGGMDTDRGKNPAAERRVIYRRSLAQPLPEPPGWLTGPADSVQADTADALQAAPADSVQADTADALQAAPTDSPQGERRRRTGGAP